ncbi:MAG: hypothetical protein CME19_23790 [Gemmatimonadetes bacterium]|nr:hypothetical protein [Gemmatimonadota bacterium]
MHLDIIAILFDLDLRLFQDPSGLLLRSGFGFSVTSQISFRCRTQTSMLPWTFRRAIDPPGLTFRFSSIVSVCDELELT